MKLTQMLIDIGVDKDDIHRAVSALYSHQEFGEDLWETDLDSMRNIFQKIERKIHEELTQNEDKNGTTRTDATKDAR